MEHVRDGQTALRACIRTSAPRNFEVFLQSIDEGCSPTATESQKTARSMKHLQAEHLAWWADVEDVAGYLGNDEHLVHFMRRFSVAVAQVGMAMCQVEEQVGRRTVVVPCIACNMAYENQEHHHQPITTISGTWSAQYSDLYKLIHTTSVLMAVVSAVLTWSEDSLQPAKDEMMRLLTVERTLGAAGNFPAGMVLPIPFLVGCVDNCSGTSPRLAHFAVAILSMVVTRRPAATLAVLDKDMVIEAMVKYVSKVSMLVVNNQCRVETFFGISQTLDALPLLFHLAEWQEARDRLGPSSLTPRIACLCINLVHNAIREEDDEAHDLEQAPELGRCFVVLQNLYDLGGAEEKRMLQDHPASFAAAATLEVLARWQRRGAEVGACRCPSSPSGDQRRGMTARQIENFTESVQDLVREYGEEWRILAERSPAFSFTLPLAQAFISGSAIPRGETSRPEILRGVLHRQGMLCALPSCNLTACADGSALLKCSGQCMGLARYCGKAHQRLHWPDHKSFCKRQAHQQAS